VVTWEREEGRLGSPPREGEVIQKINEEGKREFSANARNLPGERGAQACEIQFWVENVPLSHVKQRPQARVQLCSE
jgi:hypothetical protein